MGGLVEVVRERELVTSAEQPEVSGWAEGVDPTGAQETVVEAPDGTARHDAPYSSGPGMGAAVVVGGEMRRGGALENGEGRGEEGGEERGGALVGTVDRPLGRARHHLQRDPERERGINPSADRKLSPLFRSSEQQQMLMDRQWPIANWDLGWRLRLSDSRLSPPAYNWCIAYVVRPQLFTVPPSLLITLPFPSPYKHIIHI